MIDGDKRDAMVGYVEADEARLRVVKMLEQKATSIPTSFFCDMFWTMKEREVLELMKDIEAHGIIEAVSYDKDYPESWDLTIEGREILYALERPVTVHKWWLTDILRDFVPQMKSRVRRLFPVEP